MTEETLNEAIKRIIILRRTASPEEQARLNIKLTKLYDLKYIMLQQVHQG